jgi:hypothetical protein
MWFDCCQKRSAQSFVRQRFRFHFGKQFAAAYAKASFFSPRFDFSKVKTKGKKNKEKIKD